MGDWEDIFGSAGMREDFAPWDSPCWNDDWEHELRDNGYKTVAEWNSLGRSVKKGEKGSYLPCAKIRVFSESQTNPTNFPSNSNSSGDGKKNLIHLKKLFLGQKKILENPSQGHQMGMGLLRNEC